MTDYNIKVELFNPAGFSTGLQLLFIAFKLADVIDWSWWWVLSPMWITAIIFICAVIVVEYIVPEFRVRMESRRRKENIKRIEENRAIREATRYRARRDGIRK